MSSKNQPEISDRQFVEALGKVVEELLPWLLDELSNAPDKDRAAAAVSKRVRQMPEFFSFFVGVAKSDPEQTGERLLVNRRVPLAGPKCGRGSIRAYCRDRPISIALLELTEELLLYCNSRLVCTNRAEPHLQTIGVVWSVLSRGTDATPETMFPVLEKVIRKEICYISGGKRIIF